jgi:flagellar biogenesis protein FliO
MRRDAWCVMRDKNSKTASILAWSPRTTHYAPRASHCILAVSFVSYLFAAAASAASTLSTNLPPASPGLPDASFSVIRVFGALMLVLGLFLAGVWLFRNWQRLALRRGQPSQLQILEMKSLGGRHALYVVGYQQQRLLLASSPAGVALVSHLPAVGATEVEPAKLSSEDFVQVLQQAVQAKA